MTHSSSFILGTLALAFALTGCDSQSFGDGTTRRTAPSNTDEATGLIYSIGARDLGRHNSAFAAVQVAEDRAIYSRTFIGLQRIRP